MRKKYFYSAILSFFCLIALNSFAYAQTFTVTLDNIDDFEIVGYTFYFTIDDTALLPEVPQEITNLNRNHPGPFWSDDVLTNEKVDGKSLIKLGAADWGPLMTGTATPLTNGILLSFDYEGIFEGFKEVQFSNVEGINLFAEGTIKLASLTPSGAVFSAVPIPAAIYLFGAGLVGVIGLRRKSGR